jgi:hypothetical protein
MIDILSRFFSLLRREKLAMIMTTNARKKTQKNKYQLIDYYVENDSTLYSTLRFIALSIGMAYVDYKKKHKNISKEAQTLAFNLMKYGDVIISKKSYKILPMYSITILDKEENIGKYTNNVISEANFYVINENDPLLRKIYSSDDVIHLSLNNNGSVVKDLLGRYCYGIYSIPPTVPLLKILEWKEFLIDSDIMWRDKLMPREHHKLDIELPYNMLTGKNLDEKIKNGQMLVEQQLADYTASISNLEVGENYVTTKDVEIDIIESKSDYRSPNDLIEQLDEKIISTFNVPLSAVKGKSSSSYASELVVTSYFMLSANSIVDIINEYMEQKYPNTDFSDAKVVLEVWKTEIYKRAILASKSGVIDANEIRKMMNLETKPSNTINVQSNVDGRTVDGIVRSTERTDNNTPHRSDSRNKLLKDRSIEEI